MEYYKIKEVVRDVWFYLSKLVCLVLAALLLLMTVAYLVGKMEQKADVAQEEANIAPKTCVVLEVKNYRNGYLGMCKSTKLKTENGTFYLHYKSCPEADNLEPGDTITYVESVWASNNIIVQKVKKVDF